MTLKELIARLHAIEEIRADATSIPVSAYSPSYGWFDAISVSVEPRGPVVIQLLIKPGQKEPRPAA